MPPCRPLQHCSLKWQRGENIRPSAGLGSSSLGACLCRRLLLPGAGRRDCKSAVHYSAQICLPERSGCIRGGWQELQDGALHQLDEGHFYCCCCCCSLPEATIRVTELGFLGKWQGESLSGGQIEARNVLWWVWVCVFCRCALCVDVVAGVCSLKDVHLLPGSQSVWQHSSCQDSFLPANHTFFSVCFSYLLLFAVLFSFFLACF